VLISLEGIDCSGKTTQAALLHRSLGERALLLREPGGTEAGERMRALLKASVELDPIAELLLFCSARAELMARVIRPALEENRDVVLDRFMDSTVAYQGAGRGLGVELVERLNAAATDGAEPDVTVLLRIDPERAADRGQQRLAGQQRRADRFEGEGIEFQRRVADAYDELATRHPDRIAVVDAEGEVDDVHARVAEALRKARG
jgi:dTMP kinase